MDPYAHQLLSEYRHRELVDRAAQHRRVPRRKHGAISGAYWRLAGRIARIAAGLRSPEPAAAVHPCRQTL